MSATTFERESEFQPNPETREYRQRPCTLSRNPQRINAPCRNPSPVFEMVGKKLLQWQEHVRADIDPGKHI